MKTKTLKDYTVRDLVWCVHLMAGIIGAGAGSLPIVVWCLGIMLMQNWDEYEERKQQTPLQESPPKTRDAKCP